MGQQSRIRHESWIRGVDAAHVGEDLAGLRLERGGKRHSRRVRATASQRRHLHLVAHALEAGHDHHIPGGELPLDPSRRQPDDARLRVAPVGLDAGLKSEQRHRWDTELGERHRHQRRGDAFPGGEQQVELARSRVFRHP